MRPEKKHKLLVNALWRITIDAERLSKKFGTDDNGVQSDWKEWVNLRVAIMEAKHALDREGVSL